jgi:molybdate transport system ATP-binding protein
MQTLITISEATFKIQERIVFRDVNFTWEKGQQWVVLADYGFEQQAFLDLLLGKGVILEGQVERHFSVDYQNQMIAQGKVNSFRDQMAEVSQRYHFRNKFNQHNFYFQQRFNSMEADDAETVRNYLGNLNTNAGFWTLSKVGTLLNLEDLLEMSLIKLSNGETRRLAIAAALLKNPKILVMHQPLTGLDKETRLAFDNILQQIIESGIHVIISSQAEEIPKGITHILEVDKGQISAFKKPQRLTLKPVSPFSALYDKEDFLQILRGESTIQFSTLVVLENVTVQYGDKFLLKNVSWTVRSGERWALKGPNGSGKSTLLSLIIGEHPQAYANEVWLFDRKRGSGESIWDIKKHIGFVAPELGRFFPGNQTCLKVILSGFFDTMGLFRKCSAEQEDLAWNWMKLFQIAQIAHKLIQNVTPEEQRFVLLARALIKKPVLLVLDEAAQGLDLDSRRRLTTTIDAVCELIPCGLIYVSHYEADIPNCIDKVLELQDGKVKNIDLLN